MIKLISVVLTSGTVTLSVLANAFQENNQEESTIRKISRFLEKVNIPEFSLLAIILKIIEPKEINLAIDRTTWGALNKRINLLFISLVVAGTAIPVICRFVEGKGNSKVSERISLLEELIKGLGSRRIKSVLGDREFDSKDFVEFLLNKGIDPLIRLKKNVKVSGCRADEYFRNLATGEARTLRGKKEIFGLKLYLTGTKDKKNRLVLVLSRYKKRLLERYKKRWSIEVSFKCLKTAGFNIEKTQLGSKKPILSMIQVISIAYLIVIMLGEADGKKEVIKRGYPAKSLFKKGLNLVQTTLTVFFNFNHLPVLLASPSLHKQRCVRS